MIHVVDLDGAIAGEPRNLESIRAIRSAVKCHIDVSGGLRTIAAIRATLDAGADRVALGTIAFTDPELLNRACGDFPDRIFGSLDARDGKLAIKGWRETSQLEISEAASRFEKAGVAAMIYTDISRDGTQRGADLTRFKELARSIKIPVVASGGIASLDDVRALARCFEEGIGGVITGRALYEGRFTLAEAIDTARRV
jgi:phosphoribosylformimino-5-aminoimidazole carboxamide ribotide isomerase